ncbi:hypothetical protein DRQ33_05690, partial [bacterium]
MKNSNIFTSASIFISISILLCIPVLTAAESEPVIKSAIASSPSSVDEVTVFSDRALVVRVGTIQIPSGDSKITIAFLPQRLDKNSIRVNASGDV